MAEPHGSPAVGKLIAVFIGVLGVKDDRRRAKNQPQPLRHLALQPSALGGFKSLPVVSVTLQIEPERLEQRGSHEWRHKEKIPAVVINERLFIERVEVPR